MLCRYSADRSLIFLHFYLRINANLTLQRMERIFFNFYVRCADNGVNAYCGGESVWKWLNYWAIDLLIELLQLLCSPQMERENTSLCTTWLERTRVVTRKVRVKSVNWCASANAIHSPSVLQQLSLFHLLSRSAPCAAHTTPCCADCDPTVDIALPLPQD